MTILHLNEIVLHEHIFMKNVKCAHRKNTIYLRNCLFKKTSIIKGKFHIFLLINYLLN